MSEYACSKRLKTLSEVKSFENDFRDTFTKDLNDFLRTYALTTDSIIVSTYGDNGLNLKIETSYAQTDGSKPWSDENIREYAKEMLMHSSSGKKDIEAFLAALPAGKLIGSHIKIPGSSKRFPNETFTLTNFDRHNKYPLEVTRDRDGKQMRYIFDWGTRFVNYVDI